MSLAVEVQQTIASFRFNEGEMRKLLQGPVAQDIARRAIKVESAAKRYASGQGGGPNVRTGRLRGSITWRLGQENGTPYADVGSAVVYAPYVELGTSRMAARPYLRPGLQAAK